MTYDELKHGDEVEVYWHFNSLSFDFCWKKGKILHLIGGGKKFIPNDGVGACMLFPHRMDEVRLPVNETTKTA
jgi:hypothetical protein